MNRLRLSLIIPTLPIVMIAVSPLDTTFTEETEGAYPDTHTKHFLISLKNGAVVKAADAFDSGARATPLAWQIKN